MQRGWRYLSVSIDAPLLLAANSLWALLGYHPLQQTWLGLKLVLLVVYIVLGSFALKRGPTRVQSLLFFLWWYWRWHSAWSAWHWPVTRLAGGSGFGPEARLHSSEITCPSCST